MQFTVTSSQWRRQKTGSLSSNECSITVKQKQSETFTVQKQNPTEIVQSKILALKLVFAFISNTFGSFDCPSCCQRR